MGVQVGFRYALETWFAIAVASCVTAETSADGAPEGGSGAAGELGGSSGGGAGASAGATVGGGSGKSGAAGSDPGGSAGVDQGSAFLLYTEAATINRSLSYWDLRVDDEGTAQLREALASGELSIPWFTTDEVAFPVYWVHDGDPNVSEYQIVSDPADPVPWTCDIPGSMSTVRIPAGAHAWSAPGEHDRHLAIVDVDRNRIYSLYGWNDEFGPSTVDPTQWVAGTHGCDLLRGDDATILAQEATRWGCTAEEARDSCGMAGLGAGLDAFGSTTNAGFSAAAGVILPQDFDRPELDLGHAVQCVLPAELTNGWTWPAKFWQGRTPGQRTRNGSLLRIDPAWTLPADVPDWEARILRTWQRYGCYMADGGSGIGMHGQATWAGPDGEDAWSGVLPQDARQANGAVFLRHFPRDQVQLLEPNGPVWGEI